MNYKIDKSSTRYVLNKPILEVEGIIPITVEENVFINGQRYKVVMVTDLMVTNDTDKTVEMVREVIVIEKKYF